MGEGWGTLNYLLTLEYSIVCPRVSNSMKKKEGGGYWKLFGCMMKGPSEQLELLKRIRRRGE